MNALAATHTDDPPANTKPEVALHDLVGVPGGREGEVIGFYRREYDSVVVRFATGDSAEFLTTEVERR